jgi:predicted MFS family arabinose efflux permease
VAAASSASILPAFAKHALDATATGYGALLGAMGLGAITGGLVAKRARAVLGPRVIVASAMVVYGASTLAASSAHSVATATLFFFPLGLGWLMTLSTLNAVCQLLAPSWVKSRLLALYQMTFMIVWSVGASLGGVLAEQFAERASMVVGGIGTLAAGALVVMLKLPNTEREVTGDVTPTPVPVRTSA